MSLFSTEMRRDPLPPLRSIAKQFSVAPRFCACLRPRTSSPVCARHPS
jgi:hypothetical protein